MDKTVSITPAFIGPFTLRSKPKTINQLHRSAINAHKKCERELCKLLPLPNDLVSTSLRLSHSQLKRMREKKYAQFAAIEGHKNALNSLLQLIEWMRGFIDNPNDPWYNVPIYRVQSTTFDEFKTAGLFYKDYDSTQFKVGIYVPRENTHKTVDFTDLFINERLPNAVIMICLAPFPKNEKYKFKNPYSILEFSNAINWRVTSVKNRLNGERKPVASKISQKNCSTDEAQLRYNKESHLWEISLRGRLVALQDIQRWCTFLLLITGEPSDPWHEMPVHFVHEKTFRRFVEEDKFYRYSDTTHAKIGLAMANDTPETRYILQNQKRNRQCSTPIELAEHKRFSDVVLLVCIPPIPKWPILKWD